jgi:hypothetical protein
LPERVFQSSELYKRYGKVKFKRNLYSLRKKIEAETESVSFDQQAFDSFKLNYPRPALNERGYPYWDTSDARRILKVELSDPEVKAVVWPLEPIAVYERHDEYQAFPLEVFRNQLYHMKSTLTQDVYWQMKRNRSARRRHDEEAKVETNED